MYTLITLIIRSLKLQIKDIFSICLLQCKYESLAYKDELEVNQLSICHCQTDIQTDKTPFYHIKGERKGVPEGVGRWGPNSATNMLAHFLPCTSLCACDGPC